MSAILTVSSLQAQQSTNNLAPNGSRTITTAKSQSSIAVQKNGNPTVLGTYNDACDGTNSVMGLEARGYKVYFNGTGPVGTTATFFQGNPTVFTSFNGPDSGYVAANFNAVASGNIDNWLVTPEIATVDSGDVFSFYSQSPAGSTFADSIMVMYSAAGDSTPTGSWVMLGNFKVNTAGMWQKTSFTTPANSAGGRFAIRYKVTDGGPNGNNSDYIGIDQIELAAPVAGPVNDDCANAIDINSAFGMPVGTTTVLGPYDNTLATTVNDPTTGFECFGEPDGTGTAPTLENTMWYTFTGDGNKYFIETADGPAITNYIDDGDTQIAIYSGGCGALVPVACNEDGPSATSTTYPAGLSFNTANGTVYHMLVDGFNFNGAISMGEYNIEVTQEATVGCNDTTVTLGTYMANVTGICQGDTVRFDITGVVTPTTGVVSGLSWVVSTADITGSTDPVNDPTAVLFYTVQSPAPATSFRQFINDGTIIGNQLPYGIYYWTPVIFGNGTPLSTPVTFLNDVMLDPTCTTTGTSIMVNVYAPNDPACSVGLNDINDGFGISNVYPVPVSEVLTFTVTSKNSGKVNVSITDELGRQVISEQVSVTAGEKQFTYYVQDLDAGIYYITVTSDKTRSVSNFVKQ